MAAAPFYGYLWWVNTAGFMWPDVPADACAAMDFEEKRIYVVSSLDIVAVHLGDPQPSWSDKTFLGLGSLVVLNTFSYWCAETLRDPIASLSARCFEMLFSAQKDERSGEKTKGKARRTSSP